MPGSDRNRPAPLRDLEDRIKAARDKAGGRERRRDSAGLGIVLDRWLGTTPWLLIVFFVLGCAAGFLNVYRTAQELEKRAKERREQQARERRERDEEDRGRPEHGRQE